MPQGSFEYALGNEYSPKCRLAVVVCGPFQADIISCILGPPPFVHSPFCSLVSNYSGDQVVSLEAILNMQAVTTCVSVEPPF